MPVIPKRDRIGDFVRPTVELWCTAKSCDQFTELSVKPGNGHRPERDFAPTPICCLPDHRMVDEIEEDLGTRGVRNQ